MRMRFTGLFAVAGMAALSIACSQQSNAAGPPATSCAADRCTDHRQIGWIDRGKGLIQSKIRDPESAVFTEVRFVAGRQGLPPVVCGRVNSKNGFGGYVGPQRFLSGGSAETSVLEEQVPDFEVLWSKLC